MRVTIKGQVTIPQEIREKLGITPAVEVDFIEEKDRVYLVKRKGKPKKTHKFTINTRSYKDIKDCFKCSGPFMYA